MSPNIPIGETVQLLTSDGEPVATVYVPMGPVRPEVVMHEGGVYLHCFALTYRQARGVSASYVIDPTPPPSEP